MLLIGIFFKGTGANGKHFKIIGYSLFDVAIGREGGQVVKPVWGERQPLQFRFMVDVVCPHGRERTGDTTDGAVSP